MDSVEVYRYGCLFFAPGKWMPISAMNLLWLVDPHDLQGIWYPPPNLVCRDAHPPQTEHLLAVMHNAF
jgi:hypothetical protein